MGVGPLVVHVLDAVLGLVVLHTGPRHLAAHPFRLAPGEGGAGRALAEHPPVVFRPDAIIVEPFHTADRSLPDRKPVRRQLAKARPEVRVYIPLQHLGGRVDMRVGIINAKPVSHSALLLWPTAQLTPAVALIIGSQRSIVASFLTFGSNPD